MDYRRFAHRQIERIRRTVGKGGAVSALSGGVDSAVTTVLGHKALGGRLKVLFIDDGLMRRGEPETVRKTFARLGIKVTVVRAARKFFAALKGLTDPEE
jgi:GMP synthase (glutamine-hydrolysing)